MSYFIVFTLHYFCSNPDRTTKPIFTIMDTKKQTIDELITVFSTYLRSIHRCEATIRRYHLKWKKVKTFMESHQIPFYSKQVEKAYLQSVLGDFDYHGLDKKSKQIVNAIEALCEFGQAGRMMMGQRKHHPKVFPGAASPQIHSFLDYKKQILKLSDTTLGAYTFFLYDFNVYLNSNRISLEELRPSQLLAYIQELYPGKPANKYRALNILRSFFKYLFEQGLLVVDYSPIIPKNNYKQQPKLPSTFTDEEIGALLAAVDRGSPKGKRDYAILLLATRLGLRAGDVCGLTFANLDWEGNTIELTQQKTQKALQLPLLAEVGNAIVDYLKHGRPVSDDPHCFLHQKGPYERLHTADLGNLVRKYMRLAKINYSNRRHGPHSLRHSLASALLREKASLPVISQTLGHSTIESTLQYLRIDKDALKQCALEVPLLSTCFYEQKGGYDHD